MRVFILDDYDYDCEVFPVEGGDYYWGNPNGYPQYEVPDALVERYKETNEIREYLRGQILLIKRQGGLDLKLEQSKDGVKPKGFD
jgi:hypothetical protein